ncbi:MAG: PQQ-binding-like beta-propeller repeat protein [bacterium]|nr:PQQ-binding-like beta-propeller repeat protein [bacterium]
MLRLLSFLLVVPMAVSAAEATAPLHTLDATTGISQSFTRDDTRRLEVVRGEGETTDGQGAVLFGGHAGTGEGSKYFGIVVPLGGTHDLREQAVTFDARTPAPEATKAFYVRFYNKGEGKPAWSFSSWGRPLKEAWRSFAVQRGLCVDGLAWEKSVVEDRVADRIDRVEFIIGTREDDVDVSAVVDNLRVAPRKPGVDDLAAPKALVRDTAVVVDGKAAAIVLHPDSEEGRAAAAGIVAMVHEKTGVRIPSRVGTEQDRQSGQTAFLVGNVTTNPAMLLVYARFMTPVDAICPGTAGALVHTVFDPFGKGVNAVVVGASDAEGLGKAVDLLRDAVASQPVGNALVLPRLFERAYGEDFLSKYGWADDAPAADRLEKGLAIGQRALDQGAHTSVAGVLGKVAARYRLTGHSVEAKLFVKLWEMYEKSAVADPRKFGGPWGFDSDFSSSVVVPGWRVIEHDPALTDEERLATTKAMGRWLREAVIPSCVGAVGSAHVPHNHQTFPALGALFAGLYYTEGFDVAEGELWLRVADAVFKRQATYYKPHEDCNGYQWLTHGHLMRYTVARPDFTLYENGNGQRIIDYCIGVMDNLGIQVPYGDTGSWQCWDSETICLDIFAFAVDDPAAAWAANLKHGLRKTKALHGFQRPEPGEKPTKYDGVKVWPLEPQYHESHGAEGRPALELCFDKISFRERMAPEAAYLLLDGLSNGGHMHYDGNSIPRITQFNRIWLADNDYYKSAVKYHNSVMVLRDGQSAPIPAYIELLDAGKTPEYGFSRTRANDYAGTDWERTVVWLKAQQAFVVLDKLTAQTSDEYQLRALWHGIGEAALSEEGMFLEQNGPSMWIQVAAGPELRLYNDAALGKNWGGYVHAKPVVRSLSAIATVRLEEGESYLFATVFHGRDTGTEAPWAIGHAADGEGIVLTTDDGPVAVGLAPFSMVFGDAATKIATDTPRPNLSLGGTAPSHASLWQTALPKAKITCLSAARLDEPGSARVLLAATAAGPLYAVNAAGDIRWTVDLKTQLNDLATEDLNGDGIDEIVVARQDHHVTVLDAVGKELWSRKIEYYRRPPYVNVARTGDLDGDGTPEVIIGGENWRFYAYKADGTELWNYESVHPSRSGAVADLDGDGRAEVLCGTHYYYMSALNPDGTRRWKNNFGPICYDLTTGSFDGNATRGVVCGGGGGYVHYLGHDGTVRMKYNTGDEVKQVLAFDLDSDGKDEVIAGSLSHSVYCFGADAQRRWRVDLGAPITALAATSEGGKGLVLAATAMGLLVTLDHKGQILASTKVDAEIVHLAVLPGHVVAGTAKGELLAWKPLP